MCPKWETVNDAEHCYALRHVVELESKGKVQFWTLNLRDQDSLLIPWSKQKEDMEEILMLARKALKLESSL